ncbi:D-alanyl-D-alanine carboxypeptidase [Seohaeicola saemankumensis]|uniref:D-alanyl-D-alanine carboxypeptidase family protein n=1 Tax=Seohaeicola saemankumensis TaxID=481181 RepID=UPI001E39A4C8|nr:D-alanyl-D-alanine carboxypeptidase family protein [Seohaeicola saemankumensis]MCD1625999.1 D-alanyl-D-alanine carboxypeptidase [Seohaeicola saemankumensis]
MTKHFTRFSPSLRHTAGIAVIVAALMAPAAQAFDTRAGSAFVMDQTTGTVLLSKNAETPLPPASMSKLMTLYMLFEALERGTVTMETTFPVSSRARAMGGSTMFLNEQDTPSVRELILGIIVNSGNDACVVVAEGLSPTGTEDGFAALMTQRARELGMTETTLANASGWPNPQHRMSMRDLGVLAQRLIEDFPDYYLYFNEREYDYKNRAPANRLNRNPLFRLDIGADGLKTGHTEEAGFGLVGSAAQGDRRVIFAISGMDTDQTRAEESAAIVNWAFRQFAERSVAKAGQVIAEADVWRGDQTRVGMVPESDVTMLVPALSGDSIEAEIVHQGPINAPVVKGQILGEMILTREGLEPVRVPLVADRDVPLGGFVTRVLTTSQVLLERFTQDNVATGESGS